MSRMGTILSQAFVAFLSFASLVLAPLALTILQVDEVQAARSYQAEPSENEKDISAPAAQTGTTQGPNIIFMPLIHARASTSGSPQVINPLPGPSSGVSRVFGLGIYSWTYSLPEANLLPTSWIRPEPVIWSAIEPERGARIWSKMEGLEYELRVAAERGVQVALIITSAPSWAQKISGEGCGPIKESELSTFAQFMHDLVVRYSQPPFNVKFWEFWNEPDVDPSLSASNDFGCWGDLDDPYYGGGYYAEMLKTVYPQVKSADAQAQVLVGGLLLACDPREADLCGGTTYGALPSGFLEGILKAGGGSYFDGVSFHAYESYWASLGAYGSTNWKSSWSRTGPVIIAKGRFLREVLAKYGYSNKYLIVSEAAVAQRDEVCDSNCELTKAYFVPQLYLATLEENFLASIWYCLRCGWRHVDLLDGNGKPLPAYTATDVAWKQLQGTEYIGPIAQPVKVKVYELQRGDRRLWVAWSLEQAANTIQLPGQAISVTDVLGVRQSVGGSEIRVTLKPLYIEWVP